MFTIDLANTVFMICLAVGGIMLLLTVLHRSAVISRRPRALSGALDTRTNGELSDQPRRQ